MIDNQPTARRAAKYMKYYLGVVIGLAIFGAGVFAGKYWLIKQQITNEYGQVDITKVINLNRSINKSDSVDFDQFWEVWDEIKKTYVDKNIKDTDLFYGALQGMVMALNDPYSMYLPPKEATEFNKDLEGEFEGIGCEIGVKQNQLVVISPLPDSPAQKAGLRPGDKIIAIGPTSTLGMDVNTAVKFIRGQANTEVKLTVLRGTSTESMEIKIVRSKINVPAVLYSLLKGDIAYLRVMQFNSATDGQMNKYIKQSLSVGAKGVVLDLRNNPGGYLTSAVNMAGHWLDSGSVVVSQKDRDDKSDDLKSPGPAELKNIKTIVLINQGSASASEIVAGALHDYGRAVLIGEQTYGKGSVQDYQLLSDNSALKLTVAEWYTPKGVNINTSGIGPDIKVVEDWEKEKVGEDKALAEALKLFVSTTYKWQ
ncbi:MAG: hypothetical protein COU31_02435 [Candidatus Magasanikbacteria bacterium CG10_big_fil_rev_8_21_14_0_10_40_10]|uniref:PDZ domain-containing protein n=1 Tax=Candidatus Magasanikbacteria bacterium CG10_big_fil_rev_8_21_14_0_10_40_10 TaxID=1974648 RepID=A0A2M6W3Z8_9BACT|nr:MAG: hypothetical protein COU31_02435 [Candidatus Magasanikbacteria bacterium CG10_big_fil_rev_8_21_14_0_10_40_10]